MIAIDRTAPPERAAPTGADPELSLEALLEVVANLDGNAADAVLIDRITALERLKSGCAAAQARLTATFTASATADAAARHHRPDQARRSIAGQIGLARRDSPHTGRRHVGVAAALTNDLPHTLAALTRGDLSERRARIILEQWACLTPAGRAEADRILAPELAGLGDRAADTRAAAIAYRLDPEAALAKIRGAVKARHVTIRPAPDAMGRLWALLPVTLAVAVYAVLNKTADAATAAPGGDPRNHGQLMADALVSAVTGHHITGCDDYGVPQYGPTATPRTADTGAHTTATPDTADTGADDADSDETPVEPDPTVAAPAGPTATTTTTAGSAVAVRGCTSGCGITINLLMTDRTLLDGDDEPAHLTGSGPIPAALARALVIGAADTTTRTFLRRLYTDPVIGQLTTMDTTRRLFPPAAQRFLLARDQTCRTPWCDAPIRQYDHLQPHATGGPTTTANGQGLCQACNLTKQAPHWHTHATTNNTSDIDNAPSDNTDDTSGAIQLTTPTGHRYRSTPPPPPRSKPWADVSSLEHRLGQVLRWTA